MTYEQLHQIKHLLLWEPERAGFAVLQHWNNTVANPATETLSNRFEPSAAPCASLHPLPLPAPRISN